MAAMKSTLAMVTMTLEATEVMAHLMAATETTLLEEVMGATSSPEVMGVTSCSATLV